MADKKICDVCNKKINGFNSIANKIEDKVLCSKCYEQLAPFKVSKKYANVDELNDSQIQCIQRATDLNYSQDIIEAIRKHFDEKRKMLNMNQNIKNYLMTTGSYLEGYTVEEYLGIVSGQVVLGTGFLSSFEASFADFVGDESSIYTEKLDHAREIAKNRAIKKSIMLGGNALIGVDIELTTFSGDMISVVMNGTSVKVRKKEDDIEDII